MRSSSGAHYIALDHVRAVAAFLVFAWHFTHGKDGYPVPFEHVPALFPFSLLAESHTGVALFMTLSGYLFAKLLDGKAIRYRTFLLNRALRLLPLLLLVVLIVGIMRVAHGKSLAVYAKSLLSGALPNGGWSVVIEFQYYMVLPVFLWMLRKSRFLPLSVVIAAIALRCFIHDQRGEAQSFAFWTLGGRIDQFAFGMLAYQFRGHLVGSHRVATATLAGFAFLYWLFDLNGGFYQSPGYPSPDLVWILLPTLEGLAYAVAITWYDSSFSPPTTGVSAFVGRIGAYSYSIYLLHFFVVFEMARFVNERIMDISNFYVACLWSMACFLLVVPVGYLSFRYLETPILTLRKRYTIERTTAGGAGA